MRSCSTCVIALAIVLCTASIRAEPAAIGIDSNYTLEMVAAKKGWTDAGGKIDPFEHFAKAGCKVTRIRLWVGDDGVNRLNYAIETARRAKQAGLQPYLVIFLSEEWADFVKQPAPRVWADLPLDKKLAQIEAYCEHVVRSFAEAGVEIELFEIGNEIDFGICGVFEEEWPKRVSLEYMSQKVWPRMTPIIKAAQAGVLKAAPNARFTLHLTQWNNSGYCIAFWQAMLAAGVRVDVPGLSYFPTSATKPAERSFAYLQEQLAAIFQAIGKPVLICETGYPSAANFGGQFAAWNHAVEGYPLDEAGQAKWIADLVSVIRKTPHCVGAIYWSPEWYGGGLWDAFALFDQDGKAKQGTQSFREVIAK